MLGEVIGAGVSLLGGLFGKKKKQEVQRTESFVDYEKMAASAQAAGFNPLTALRNGGSAGFTSSTTSHPGLSSNADIGASLGQFGSALAGFFDPVARKQRQVESALLDYQLATIQSGKKKPMMFGDVPSARGSRVVARPTPALGRKVYGPFKNAPGEGAIVGGDNPTASSLGLNNGRYGWFHAPWWPDAEAVETVYGDNEIFSTIGGGVKSLVDLAYSGYRNGYSALEDGRAATLRLPNKQSKSQAKFLKEFNGNLDRMFGAEYKRSLKTSW